MENRKYGPKSSKEIKYSRPKSKRRIKNAKNSDYFEVKEYADFKTICKKLSSELIFKEEDKVHAEIFFNNNNLYRFYVYAKSWRNSDEKMYKEIIKIYELENFLRNELYYFLSHFEIKWKSEFIKILCENYPSDTDYEISQCFLDIDLYSGFEWGNKIIENWNDCYNDSNSLYFKHHKQNKNDCVPIWVMMEEITFGQFTTFILQIDKKYLRAWVNEYYPNPTYIKPIGGWIDVIRNSRNRVSHHSRFYGINATKTPKILGDDRRHYFDKEQEQKLKLYGILYVIKKLLIYDSDIVKNKWNIFLEQFEKEITKINLNEEVLNKNYGLPTFWRQRLSI
jgi:abortive infection bacteriophage resistance protein